LQPLSEKDVAPPQAWVNTRLIINVPPRTGKAFTGSRSRPVRAHVEQESE